MILKIEGEGAGERAFEGEAGHSGALVDRWDRRVVMIVADAVAALSVLALAGLFASGGIQIWHVYLATLLRATMQAFQLPAMQASTSLMVPPFWSSMVTMKLSTAV